MSEPFAGDEVYRIRRPEVVSEVFEGEAVVVDLVQGRYYALSPLASELWSRLELSPTLGELVEAARGPFGGDAAARASLEPFLDSLVEAGLLARGRRLEASPAALAPLSADGLDLALGFETYTDLEELLVLDPIHELDETGWPLPPESREAGREPEPGR
jgi:hypothetical protein